MVAISGLRITTPNHFHKIKPAGGDPAGSSEWMRFHFNASGWFFDAKDRFSHGDCVLRSTVHWLRTEALPCPQRHFRTISAAANNRYQRKQAPKAAEIPKTGALGFTKKHDPVVNASPQRCRLPRLIYFLRHFRATVFWDGFYKMPRAFAAECRHFRFDFEANTAHPDHLDLLRRVLNELPLTQNFPANTEHDFGQREIRSGSAKCLKRGHPQPAAAGHFHN